MPENGIHIYYRHNLSPNRRTGAISDKKQGDAMIQINIVCFGGNDWWYHNHNHYDVKILRELAQCGGVGNCIFINSIVMQKPNISQGRKFAKKLIRKVKSICRGLKKSGKGFWVYSLFSLPVHHSSWLRPLNRMILQFQVQRVSHKLGIQNPVVWVACPAACDVAINMERSRLVYQRTDRFEEYPNVDIETIKNYDQKLKSLADLTIFASSALYAEESSQCKAPVYLDHGVDFEMFSTAENIKEIPTDMKNIQAPIVGFFGGIDNHTSDIELIEKVTELLSEMNFVFVGTASADCSGFRSRRNVWMLGQKPYEQIPYYGKCFDVAIMPWRQNRWIQACNPVKLKEYLALGKPIVSTPFPELQKYRDVVYEAKTSREFARCIEKALAEDGPEHVAARKKKVEKATWVSKAQLVLEELFGKNCDFQRLD